jgi:hypothetical protein
MVVDLHTKQTKQTLFTSAAVRKVKFFLHPDKLPHDFNADQKFLCRTLWDITADSLEAFENE